MAQEKNNRAQITSLSHNSTEKAVLATVINNITLGWFGHVTRVAGRDSAAIFSDHKNRAVFQALEDVYDSNPHPSIPAVIDRIATRYSGVIDNPEGFVSSLQVHPSLTSVDQITSSVEELVSLREMRKQVSGMERIIQDMTEKDVASTPNDIATRMQHIIDDTNVETAAETFADIATDVLDSPRPMWNVKTGVSVIDKSLGGNGLESGCFTIAAARPKVGKTILMNSLIFSVLQNGGIPLVLNLETKKIEFFSKIVARYIEDKEVGWGKIKSYITQEEMDYPLTLEQEKKIQEGFEWAKQQEWLVSFDKNMTTQDIQAFVMKAKALYPHDAKIVLFVDYIQLQVQNSMREREEIANLSRFYKKLAGIMDISVFSLAQLNREAGDSKPKIHQLRGSGALEQDADAILLLDRPFMRKKDESSDTEDHPPYLLNIDASVSRLSEGGEEGCFIDGASQFVCDMPSELTYSSIEEDEEVI